jgi:hypothetical protein
MTDAVYRGRRFGVALLILVFSVFADPAFAACTSPAGIAGQLSLVGGVAKLCDGTSWGAFGSSVPGGSNTHVQFNSSSAFGGDSALVWDNTNKRLGIGTATPSYVLDVYGASGIGLVDGGGATYDSTISHSSSSPYRFLTLTSKAGTGSWRGAINFDMSYNAGSTFTGMTVRANTDGTTANVAIGTATPGAAFHVQRGTTDAVILVESTGGASYDQSIHFKDTASDWYVGNLYSGATNGFGIGRTAVKSDFVIDSSGNVGIGTAPGLPLEVYASNSSNWVARIRNMGATNPYGMYIQMANDASTGMAFGILNAAGTAWPLQLFSNGMAYLSQTGGFTQIGGSVRAPLFYDSDNTGYYVDPASTSILYDVNIYHILHNQGMPFDGSGYYTCAIASGAYGSWYFTQGYSCATSDARAKENIKPLENGFGLAAIAQLKPVTFDWKDVDRKKHDGRQIGFLAQDVQKVLPQLVYTNSDSPVKLADGTTQTIPKMLSFDYAKLVIPLVKAMQELKEQNDKLRVDFEANKAAFEAYKAAHP